MCLAQTTSKNSSQNPGFPRVVARLNLLNRTKEVGPATLYTPNSSGVFRVSIVMTVTVGNGVPGTWNSALFYVPLTGLNQQSFSCSISSAQPFSDGIQAPFSAAKDNPITVSITGSWISGSQYNAYIILEQLE
jgi:hypothetical protein